MKLVSVGPHSWACLGGGDDVLHSFGANQGFVVDEGECLVVDSGFHYKTAREIFGSVRRKGASRLTVVDTHYHSDHVFGNGLFAGKGGAVLSHDKCRGAMLRKSAGLLAKYRARYPKLESLLRDVKVSYPSITYRDRVRGFVGIVGVDVFHPGGRAHTDGDSIVYVPKDGVVFAGDVLWVGYHPNLEDSDIQGLLRALRMILGLRPRKVVPGHGPVCGVVEVRRFMRYLEELDRKSRAMVRDGVEVEEVVRGAVPGWSEGWKMRRLVEAYLRKLAEKRKV